MRSKGTAKRTAAIISSVGLVAIVASIAYGLLANRSVSASSPVGLNHLEAAVVTTLPTVPVDQLQATVLADGIVSHDEMLETLNAVVACFKEDGLDATLEEFIPGHSWGFIVETSIGAESARVDARDAYCWAKLLSQVEPTYLAQHALTPEEIAVRANAILQCLSELEENDTAGLTLREVALDHDVVGFEDCERSVDRAEDYRR